MLVFPKSLLLHITNTVVYEKINYCFFVADLYLSIRLFTENRLFYLAEKRENFTDGKSKRFFKH